MRFLWAIALATAAVRGQSISESVADLPVCSRSCFSSAVAKTSCGTIDYVCQCTSGKDTITNAVTECLLSSTCTPGELQQIQEFSLTFCPKVLSAQSSSVNKPNAATSTSSVQSVSAGQSPKPATTSPPSSVATSTQASPASTLINIGAKVPGTDWRTLKPTNSKANRGPALEAASIAFFVLATLVVAFRIFARLRLKHTGYARQGLGWDEFFACIALLFTGASLGTMIVGVNAGLGKHLWNQTARDLVLSVKMIYVFVIVIVLCFGALKVSILCLYLRMTSGRRHYRTIYTVLAIIACHDIAATIASIFQCHPISEFWNIGHNLEHDGKCINILTFNIFNSAFSVAGDLVIWALPLPVIWNLKVPVARKAGLYGLLGVSAIAVVASCVRLSSIIIWTHSSDISWNYILLPFLCNLEACVALITSSIPAIYPLFRKPPPNVRQSMMMMKQQQQNNEWNSQGSTLITDSRPSRWSRLSWLGPGILKTKEIDVQISEKELASVKEEEPMEAPPTTSEGLSKPSSEESIKSHDDEKVVGQAV